jgi:hypothetical protein
MFKFIKNAFRDLTTIGKVADNLVNYSKQIVEYQSNFSKDFILWARQQLGGLYLPCVEFELRKNILLANTPQLSEEEAAAITYFAMLAETPQPTSNEIILVPNWSEAQTPLQMISTETAIFDNEGNLTVSPAVANYERAGITTAYNWRTAAATGDNETYQFNARFVPKSDVYLNQVKKLQKYLIKRGLWDGVQKTLSEESRSLQALLAAAQAQEQAAAYKAAMARQLAEEGTDRARAEAAKQIAEAEKAYKDAEAYQNEIKNKLNRIENGLTPEDEKGGFGLSTLLGLGAAALFFLR